MDVLAFSIKTIPDLQGGRRLYGLQDVSDKEVGSIMFHKRRQQTGSSENLPHHLQRIISLSVILRKDDGVSLQTFSGDELEIVKTFAQLHAQFHPVLVSWNGSAYELPVLNFRMLAHAQSAPTYWQGACEDEHCDAHHHLRTLSLSDELTSFNADAHAPLQQAAAICGLPVDHGLDNAGLWQYYLNNELDHIIACNDVDVITIYLLFLRYQKMNGALTHTDYDAECELLRNALQKNSATHIQEYLSAWSQAKQ